ncbi:hypothetical protein [Denitromonas iodatirespirans]|uniref:DUF2946 domain-containing protein n=1 Tax=Denitromonas iodatirespirans TaxID=2795389 RepID=A0A944D6M3_DENI1|nr:hypothetical protein [Denitromonas iodatirespirans]MBT0960899.1 hypothetical protein [Denitromonas iodatirespirans]
MHRMWRRWVILLLMLALPLPSLAAWRGDGCAPAGGGMEAPAMHAMADADEHAAAPCCPDTGKAGGCTQADCAAVTAHLALPVRLADNVARTHVLVARTPTVRSDPAPARHDRPPIPSA